MTRLAEFGRNRLVPKVAAVVAVALVVVSGSLLFGVQIGSATAAAAPGFQLIYQDNFTTNVPLGAFSDCNHNVGTSAVYCGGLAAYPSVEANWWSYPAGWADTATERHLPLGGFYDPATTVWISGGEMHVRMWRGATGPNHSVTMVPKITAGMLYGQFTETFEVSHVATGFKSAHLLWPAATCPGCEIDFPEGDWNGSIEAFNHPKGGGRQDSFGDGTPWTGWHTSTIQWSPGHVTFILDGKVIGESTNNVMDTPAEWDIQNESSLDGEMAAPNTSAEMDIKSVSVYSYRPGGVAPNPTPSLPTLDNVQFNNLPTSDHQTRNDTEYCPRSLSFVTQYGTLGDCVEVVPSLFGYMARTGYVDYSTKPKEFVPTSRWSALVRDPGHQVEGSCNIGGSEVSYEAALYNTAYGGLYWGDVAVDYGRLVIIRQAIVNTAGACQFAPHSSWKVAKGP